jgi:GMP synthase-like glutamine amidotransferase
MKLLVLQHVPHEGPGYISEYAQNNDMTLEVVELWESYSMPDVKNYDALIILGGPQGVYEEFPSKTDEIQAIRTALGKVRILGICLGSQLLAHVLGAEVYPNVIHGKRVKEIGYSTVDLTEQGERAPILQGFGSPLTVLQWHGDVFELPRGAQRLATSSVSETQAFSINNAFGFLFHLEFTPEMVFKQIKIDNEWIHADIEVDEEILMDESEKTAHVMKKQCFALLDNFLDTETAPN